MPRVTGLGLLGLWRGSYLSGAGHTKIPAMFDRFFGRIRLSRLLACCRNHLGFKTALRDRYASLPLLNEGGRALRPRKIVPVSAGIIGRKGRQKCEASYRGCRCLGRDTAHIGFWLSVCR